MVDRTADVVCDVGVISAPDCETLDALARLQLAVRRRGCELLLVNVSPNLRELVELAGLDEVLHNS